MSIRDNQSYEANYKQGKQLGSGAFSDVFRCTLLRDGKECSWGQKYTNFCHKNERFSKQSLTKSEQIYAFFDRKTEPVKYCP